MSRRRARLRTALVGLCALLLSHWTLAAHACPVYGAAGQALAAAAAAAPAPDETAAHPSAGSHTGCADEAAAESAICVKHCGSEEQATTQPPAVAAASVVGVLRIAELSPQGDRPAAYWRVPARGHPPPLKRLYCVSLT